MNLPKLTKRQALAAVGVFAVMTVLPGCLEMLIDADPPLGSESRLVGGAPIPPSMNVSKSIRARNAWAAQEAAFLESWDASIKAGQDKIQFWEGALNTITSPEGLVTLGLSPSTGGVSAGLFLAGLFTRRPGDTKKA